MALPLVELGALALVLWAVAMALAAALLMQKIGSVLGGLPAIGGAIQSAMNKVAQEITNAAGTLENGIDSLIGASWHALAGFTNTLWHEIEAHSGIIAQYGGMLGKLIDFALHVKALATHAARNLEHGLARVGQLARTIEHLAHRVKALEHDWAHGIGDDVLPRIKSLERKITHVTHDVIPAVESAEEALARDVTALGEYIRTNFLSTTTDAITAAVALGLAALGLGGLRCSTLTNMLGKRACGLWSDLEGLLGLFADTILLTNICELLPVLETAVSDVADPLVVTLADVGAGLCSGGIGAPPALSVPALSLPANPGFSLNLP